MSMSFDSSAAIAAGAIAGTSTPIALYTTCKTGSASSVGSNYGAHAVSLTPANGAKWPSASELGATVVRARLHSFSLDAQRNTWVVGDAAEEDRDDYAWRCPTTFPLAAVATEGFLLTFQQQEMCQGSCFDCGGTYCRCGNSTNFDEQEVCIKDGVFIATRQ